LAGKLVPALHLTSSSAVSGEGDLIYVITTPRIDLQAQVIQLEDFTLANDASEAAPPFPATLNDEGLVHPLQTVAA
jgi:hypothetical protein